MASAPDQLCDDELKALLQGIQASVSTVRSVSNALKSSETVGGFIYFRKLPIKLRQKIWRHSLEGLRIVEVYRTWGLKRRERVPRLGVNQAPNPIFHVCFESRQVALKKYTLQLSISSADLANTRIDLEEELSVF